jgi:hypothetical protein
VSSSRFTFLDGKIRRVEIGGDATDAHGVGRLARFAARRERYQPSLRDAVLGDDDLLAGSGPIDQPGGSSLRRG